MWEKAAYYLVLKVKMFLGMLLYFAVFRLYWGMQDSINLTLVNTTNYWYQAGTSQPVCGSPEELCNYGCILIKTSVGCHICIFLQYFLNSICRLKSRLHVRYLIWNCITTMTSYCYFCSELFLQEYTAQSIVPYSVFKLTMYSESF